MREELKAMVAAIRKHPSQSGAVDLHLKSLMGAGVVTKAKTSGYSCSTDPHVRKQDRPLEYLIARSVG